MRYEVEDDSSCICEKATPFDIKDSVKWNSLYLFISNDYQVIFAVMHRIYKRAHKVGQQKPDEK